MQQHHNMTISCHFVSKRYSVDIININISLWMPHSAAINGKNGSRNSEWCQCTDWRVE
jgi:hypothetical protein